MSTPRISAELSTCISKIEKCLEFKKMGTRRRGLVILEVIEKEPWAMS